MDRPSGAIDEPPPTPEPRRFDEDGDATRRTWLASERTVLAWLRTGLTATAVALGVGKLIPDLRTGGKDWPFVVLGAGYAILGVLHRRSTACTAGARSTARSARAAGCAWTTARCGRSEP